MKAAMVLPLAVQRMVCTGCGAEANASCNCGKTYVPAAVRAAEAVKANPEKSDRAIAKEIGASPTTVGKARELSIGGQLAERIGLDGKTRQMPKRHRGQRMSETTDEPQHDRDLRMLKGIWDGACDSAQLEFIQWLEDTGAMPEQDGPAKAD